MKLISMPLKEAADYVKTHTVYAVNIGSGNLQLVEIGKDLADLQFFVAMPEPDQEKQTKAKEPAPVPKERKKPGPKPGTRKAVNKTPSSKN